MSRGKKLAVALIAAVIGAPLLFFAGSLAYISLRYSGTGIYEANWGVTVPRGLTELYSDDGTGGIHGDGPRYTVYSCGDVAGLGVELSPGADAAFRSGFDMVTDELGVRKDTGRISAPVTAPWSRTRTTSGTGCISSGTAKRFTSPSG